MLGNPNKFPIAQSDYLSFKRLFQQGLQNRELYVPPSLPEQERLKQLDT